MGHDEVWVAALFWGQAKPEAKDIQSLSEILHIGANQLEDAYGEDHFFPDRAKLIENPPRDPYDFDCLRRTIVLIRNFSG